MAYKSILLHVEPQGSNSVLASAAALAATFDARAVGVGAESLRPVETGGGAYMGGVDGQWIVALQEQIDSNIKAAEAAFRAALGARAADWRTSQVSPNRTVAAAARAADLVLAPADDRESRADPNRSVDAGELIVSTGRPVLVCPNTGAGPSLDRVMVAWKDTREARRALTDALPLLQKAGEVVVVEVAPGDDADGAEWRTSDVAATLALHGVKAKGQATAKSGSTTDTLLAAADALGAGVLVAGAYGHSRFGEWAFGGVTRSLLRHSGRHVLLSH